MSVIQRGEGGPSHTAVTTEQQENNFLQGLHGVDNLGILYS